MENIYCKFEISTYYTLCSRWPTKVLALSRINVPGGHLVFQNEAKNIPRQDFMVTNISCKFEKASYNNVFGSAVTANNKKSVTDMKRSHTELLQTLVSDKISQATEKIWSQVGE